MRDKKIRNVEIVFSFLGGWVSGMLMAAIIIIHVT